MRPNTPRLLRLLLAGMALLAAPGMAVADGYKDYLNQTASEAHWGALQTQIADGLTNQYATELVAKLKPSPEKEQALRISLKQKAIQLVKTHLAYALLATQSTAVLQEFLTAGDATAIANFYQSDAGRKLRQRLPTLFSDSTMTLVHERKFPQASSRGAAPNPQMLELARLLLTPAMRETLLKDAAEAILHPAQDPHEPVAEKAAEEKIDPAQLQKQLQRLFPPEKLVPLVAHSMGKIFSADDIGGILSFYRTPAGAKLLGASVQMVPRLNQLADTFARNPKVDEEMKKYASDLTKELRRARK